MTNSPIFFQKSLTRNSATQGFTLVEIIVSVGIFALVMVLASGAYLMMVGLNRQAQGIASGIDNISFALETMTRDIRSGSGYQCPSGGDTCTIDATTGQAFSFTNTEGETVSYTLDGNALEQQVDSVQSDLTDSSVSITALTFYVYGVTVANSRQANVVIVVTGSVASSADKLPQTFNVETMATMRGPDI